MEPYLVPWQRPSLEAFMEEKYPNFFAKAKKYGVFEIIHELDEYTFFIPAVDIGDSADTKTTVVAIRSIFHW